MKKTIALIGLLLGLAFGLRGGDDAVQFWQVFGFDWEPVAGLRLKLEKQLRYQDTFVEVESDITQVGIHYRVKEWLSVQADYRFVAMGDEKRNRVDGNILFSWSWPSFAVSNRARLQKEFIETLAGSHSELVFRDRLRVSFLPGRKLQPFVGGEIFLGLDEAGKSENKFRLSSGLDFDLSKRVKLSLFYHFQHDIGEKTNETFHIIGGRFHYSF